MLKWQSSSIPRTIQHDKSFGAGVLGDSDKGINLSCSTAMEKKHGVRGRD